MNNEDSNGCDNYNSWMNINASTAEGISTDFTVTFALDCKHLMACGKCDLNDEECPIHKKKPTYPTYKWPRFYPYPVYPWWYWDEPYYYVNQRWTTSESNHW
jgi:hypothetical protein